MRLDTLNWLGSPFAVVAFLYPPPLIAPSVLSYCHYPRGGAIYLGTTQNTERAAAVTLPAQWLFLLPHWGPLATEPASVTSHYSPPGNGKLTPSALLVQIANQRLGTWKIIGESQDHASFRAEQGQLKPKPIDRRAVKVHKECCKAAKDLES